MENIENLKYPIGKFSAPSQFSMEDVKEAINYLAYYPTLLEDTVKGLSTAELETPYREGGWTVKQLLHHITDSHLNAYIRFKLALTEDNPTIKPYLEAEWAKLYDSQITPVTVSLTLLDALHQRWINLLNAMTEPDFQKTYFHPESQKTFTLGVALSLYHWHGRHHLAHITELMKKNGWQ